MIDRHSRSSITICATWQGDINSKNHISDLIWTQFSNRKDTISHTMPKFAKTHEELKYKKTGKHPLAHGSKFAHWPEMCIHSFKKKVVISHLTGKAQNFQCQIELQKLISISKKGEYVLWHITRLTSHSRCEWNW